MLNPWVPGWSLALQIPIINILKFDAHLGKPAFAQIAGVFNGLAHLSELVVGQWWNGASQCVDDGRAIICIAHDISFVKVAYDPRLAIHPN